MERIREIIRFTDGKQPSQHYDVFVLQSGKSFKGEIVRLVIGDTVEVYFARQCQGERVLGVGVIEDPLLNK